jgi:hypothetical protein
MCGGILLQLFEALMIGKEIHLSNGRDAVWRNPRKVTLGDMSGATIGRVYPIAVKSIAKDPVLKGNN